jgi:hypothetical protein
MNWGTSQQVQLAALTGHQVLLGGLEGMVVGMDGTRLPCIGGTLQRHGLESMTTPIIQRLSEKDRVALIFATEMHWHHRTNPYERALRQVAVRYKNLRTKPCSIKDWTKHIRDWPEIPANGLGSKGWNGGGPDQFQLSRLIKSCELMLPGLEALDALHTSNNRHAAKIRTLWKRLFFLNDNHIRWFIHNHKLIFIPAGKSLLTDVNSLSTQLLVEMSDLKGGNAPRLIVWNLLGWDRRAYAEATVDLPPGFAGLRLRSPGEERPALQVTPLVWGSNGDLRKAKVLWEIRNLPAWGYRAFDLIFLPKQRIEPKSKKTTPLELENSRLKARFSGNGEIILLEDKKTGRVLNGGNRLLNLIPQPYTGEQMIKAGIPLREQGEDFAGCFSVSADVTLPEVATYHLHLDEMQGCFVLVEVDVIDSKGHPLAPTRRFPIINLHWMDAPHRHADGRNIPLGELAAGIRLRITLWFISEGESRIGAGAVFSKRNNLVIDQWNLRWNYRFEAVPGESIKVEELERGHLRQVLRFHGKLPQCSYETTVTLLGPKQSRLDFETCFAFPEETQLGFPTPPVPAEVGSYFGSNNERPYIPGLAVTFPSPTDPDLLVDMPYTFRDPTEPVHPEIVQRTWLAGETELTENFWWGLSPFSGLTYMAIRNWCGLIADGTPHFFLWRGLPGTDETVFGLSFGSSLIHPRTVTKRVSPESEWFDFGRGPGYSDFQDGTDNYSFNHPKGSYKYRYSLSLETDPTQLKRESQEAFIKPRVIAVDASKGTPAEDLEAQALLKIDNKNVFLSGCELLETDDGTDLIRVRFVELVGKETVCSLACYRIIKKVEQGELPVHVEQDSPNTLFIQLPAHGVRELLLTLAPGPTG